MSCSDGEKKPFGPIVACAMIYIYSSGDYNKHTKKFIMIRARNRLKCRKFMICSTELQQFSVCFVLTQFTSMHSSASRKYLNVVPDT